MDYKKKKIRRLRAIWFKLGIDHMRADILAQYDVVSTKDLSELQLDELIKCYGDQLDSPRDIRKERSIVIMLLTEMDIYKNDGNWERVNEYLMNDRIAGKLLFQMSKQELKALQIKLRAIKNKNIEKELTYCPN